MWRNMGRKNFNTTIDEATIETIERLAVGGKSKGDVIDAAVALLACPPVDLEGIMRQLARETWARLDEVLETVQTVQPEPDYQGQALPRPPGYTDPASVPGVTVGPPVPRYKCDHCGLTPAVSRVGDICPSCRREGHRGEPRDCRACSDNHGTGAC